MLSIGNARVKGRTLSTSLGRTLVSKIAALGKSGNRGSLVLSALSGLHRLAEPSTILGLRSSATVGRMVASVLFGLAEIESEYRCKRQAAGIAEPHHAVAKEQDYPRCVAASPTHAMIN